VEASLLDEDGRFVIARWLCELSRRPEVESPLFVEVFDVKQQSFPTIIGPDDGSGSLPVSVLLFAQPTTFELSLIPADQLSPGG
jgi:hypothetical protein